MVFPYYVQIHSDTPFMVGNKEFVQQYCLPETQSYQVIGGLYYYFVINYSFLIVYLEVIYSGMRIKVIFFIIFILTFNLIKKIIF